MQPRREPLLWLQCLAIGAIPLELLLIRVLLAGRIQDQSLCWNDYCSGVSRC